MADVSLLIEAVDRASGVLDGLSANASRALGFAAKSAVDFDTAISGASRALDLSGKEVDAFKQQVLAIAPPLGMLPTQFADLATEAGKLGVSKDKIAEFSKIVAEIAAITDVTGEGVTKLAGSFAALQTITGVSTKDLEIFGAAVNKLDDSIGGTTPEIIEFVRQTAAAGKLLRLDIRDLAAYGSTMQSLGIQNGVAYRSFSALITKLAAPQTLSKAGQQALGDLGLSAQQMATIMTTDANQGIDLFLGRIRELSKTDVSKALGATKTIIGGDYADEILTLALASDKYKSALAAVGDTSGNLAKKQDEVAKKLGNVKGQMAIASANAQKLGIILGSALLPSINDLISKIIPGVEVIGKFAEANPIFVKIAAVALAAVAALSPIVSIISAISTASAVLTPIMAGVGTIFAGVTVAGLLPFVAAGVVIGGLAALIYTNWSGVSGFFSNMWSTIATSTSSFISFFTPALQLMALPFLAIANVGIWMANQIVQSFSIISSAVMPVISSVTATVGNFVSGMFQSGSELGYNLLSGINQSLQPIYGFFNDIFGWIGARINDFASWAYNAGASIINQLSAGIAASFNSLINNFNSQLAQLRSYLPSSDAERGALSDLSKSGRSLWDTFASGMNAGIPVAVNAIGSGTNQLLPNVSATGSGGATSSNQVININFNPTISGNSTPDLIAALQAESRRLIEMLRAEGLRLDRNTLS